jgi:hypothetical protein
VSFLRDRGTTVARIHGIGFCSDRIDLNGLQLNISIGRARTRIGFVPHSGSIDPLRTHCPGPMLGERSLATASLPTGVFAQHQFTVHIRRGTSFRDRAYRIKTASSLAVTLTRTGASATGLRADQVVALAAQLSGSSTS